MKNTFLWRNDPQTFIAVYRERLNNVIHTSMAENAILWGCFLMLMWNEGTPLTTVMSFVLLTISLASAAILWSHVRFRRTFDKLILKPLPILERNAERIGRIGHDVGRRLLSHSIAAAGIFFVAGCVSLVFENWVGLLLIPWSFWLVWREHPFVARKTPFVSEQRIGLKLPKM